MATPQRMNPLDSVLDALGAAGCRPRQRGKQWYARCPVHGGDDVDSLSCTEGNEGRVLLTCHSQGCRYDEILSALGLDGKELRPRTADIGGVVVPLRRCPERRSEPDVVYDYVDEAGVLLYQVCRYQLEHGKTFRQRRPDGAGGWTWGLDDTRRVLYRLPELAAGGRIFVVEGEKDVETLRSLGLVATCCMGGAIEKASGWAPEWSEALRGAEVIILPDNDEPGRRHAASVREALDGYVRSCRVVELPGLGAKGDVSDWVACGGTRDALLALCRGGRLVSVDFVELLSRELPRKRSLIDPWLYSQDLVMVYAERGIGKTMFLLELALGLASGGPVLGWTCPEPVRVLYVDGEMPAVTMQERIAAAIAGRQANVQIPPLLVTPDLQPLGIRRLSTAEGRQDLLYLIDDVDPAVVFLDNLSCLYGGAENDADAWDEMQGFLLALRTRGRTDVMAHHAGKAGTQRGTSRREDVLDTVIRLSRPKDYHPEQGARFMVDFEKSRNLNGTEVKGLDVQLVDLPEGGRSWSWRSGEEAELMQLVELVGMGMTQRQIATELGCSLGTVNKRMRTAKARGMVE